MKQDAEDKKKQKNKTAGQKKTMDTAKVKKHIKNEKIKKSGEDGKKDEVFVSRNGKDVTWMVRSNLYPEGCSTCRNREGCTRSCWIRRRLD